MLATINVTDEKCDNPLECRKCLLACPTRVLGLGTNVGPRKYRETPEQNFIVRGVRLQFCTGCGKCVEICPTGAIAIGFGEAVGA